MLPDLSAEEPECAEFILGKLRAPYGRAAPPHPQPSPADMYSQLHRLSIDSQSRGSHS